MWCLIKILYFHEVFEINFDFEDKSPEFPQDGHCWVKDN